MKLLLISNSTNAGEAYLDYPKHNIKDFLGEKIGKVLFIPYAIVTNTFDIYEKMVADRFSDIGIEVESIHHNTNPEKAVQEAQAIVVGGGNTFRLVQLLWQNNLIDAIRQKVRKGTPYIGWSAGSNVACLSLKTTNDMPVVEPKSFETLQLIPFQINPHYNNAQPLGHAGETRDMRIAEFLEMNKTVYVLGLKEGTMLRIEDKQIKLIGDKTAKIFKHGTDAYELTKMDDFDFLME